MQNSFLTLFFVRNWTRKEKIYSSILDCLPDQSKFQATLNYPDCAEVMRRWIEHLSSTYTSQQVSTQ